ncbi:MAG: tRNA (adenosine(37)-N6)-threonylcarbamoyltransferase complex transferase subunit TsaD [Candidatus Hydrogenedentes bacterium]|nr:tRNA (adenosine(37)-N6)-threonylcarbamoyltransferase complex transferase subunit TsaD [Candidatus Hydrogenedentota bacterium]
MYVLGIETSCDETGVAIVKNGRDVINNYFATQVPIHAQFGGVVPEIASRQHLIHITYLVRKVLEESNAIPDAVAVTQGPGLMGSLLVGVNFAKAYAWANKIPIIPIHHIEGHIFSAMLLEKSPEFPFLALVVSGGHTMLIECKAPHEYKIIGNTRDDAVGECFDKVARLLGLPYPGGPSIQKTAEKGNPHAIKFPLGLSSGENLEFSYSGLKTSVLYKIKDTPQSEKTEQWLADISASFQWCAIEVLINKTKLALKKTGLKKLVIGGGVSANALLRKRAVEELDAEIFLPPLKYCLDNGAMIASAGYSRLFHGYQSDFSFTANPSLPLC